MNWRGILTAIGTDLTPLVAALSPVPKIGAGWPAVTALQGVAKGVGPIISVFDRGIARDTTRWIDAPIVSGAFPTIGLTTVIAQFIVGPGRSTTLTITGTPVFANGDAASFILTQSLLGNVNAGIVYVVQTNDTLNTFTAGLAAAITTAFGSLVTAAAVNNVITITNNTSGIITLGSATGAGATMQQEVRRANRQVGIHVWAKTPDIRDSIGDIIEGRLSTLQRNFGYNFLDGTFGRVTFQSDVNVDDNTLQDVYRRDFFIGIDYGVTVADQVYTVLLTQNNITAEPAQ